MQGHGKTDFIAHIVGTPLMPWQLEVLAALACPIRSQQAIQRMAVLHNRRGKSMVMDAIVGMDFAALEDRIAVTQHGRGDLVIYDEVTSVDTKALIKLLDLKCKAETMPCPTKRRGNKSDRKRDKRSRWS